MLYKSLTLFIGATLAASMELRDSVVALEYPGLVIQAQVPTENGTMVYYAAASQNSTNTPPRVQRRACGSNIIHCDPVSNRAPSDSCLQLLLGLPSNHNGIPIGSILALCYIPGNIPHDQCCISWHDPMQTIWSSYYMLLPAGNKIYDQCYGDGKVSGYTSETLIGDTCTNECMSNSPGC